MPQRPPPSARRPDPPDIAELKRLKTAHPELATAIDLQVALIEVQRRVQGRVPLPSVSFDAARVAAHLASGRPMLRFEEIPLDWTDFRLLFRQTAELLRRHDSLEEADYGHAQRLAREGNLLEPAVRAWYARAAERAETADPATPEADAALPDMIEEVVVIAMRPFLMRCAEGLLSGLDLAAWRRPRCPLCGGDPEFATLVLPLGRRLICSRCTGQWPFETMVCPFCGNSARDRLTSFVSRDRRYRIDACDVCLRYLKAYDPRGAARPVMVQVDAIATLPLDAAAMQKGYRA